jgi:hypothetical protein
MNYKRGKPKNRRSGCLLCKPFKVNGAKNRKSLKTKNQRILDDVLRDEVKEMLDSKGE